MATVRALDPIALRADFAIFERDFRGRKLAYLDSAATSLKPRVVAEAMSDYLNRYSANVHRGIYEIGEEATAAYEGARAKIAKFLGGTRSARDRHGPQRDGGDQPRRLCVGPQEHQARGHDRDHGDGAPLQPDPLAAARPGEGRRPRVRALR